MPIYTNYNQSSRKHQPAQLLFEQNCPDLTEGKPCLKAPNYSPVQLSQQTNQSQLRSYQWLIQTLSSNKSTQKEAINYMAFFVKKDNQFKVYLKESKQKLNNNSVLFNFICKQKLNYYNKFISPIQKPNHQQKTLNQVQLQKRINTFKNRLMLYSTDLKKFLKIPFQNMAIQIRQYKGALYSMNTTQFTWLMSYKFQYPRWKRICSLKLLPQQKERIQYKQLQLSMLAQNQDFYGQDSIELLSWRVAILCEWQSRVQLVSVYFIWIKDLDNRLYLHDTRQLLVKQIPKYKAFQQLIIRNQKALSVGKIFDLSKLKINPKAIQQKQQKMNKYHSLIKSNVGHFQIKIPSYNLQESKVAWQKLRPKSSFKQMLKMPYKQIQNYLRTDLQKTPLHIQSKYTCGFKFVPKKSSQNSYKTYIKQILQISKTGRAQQKIRYRKRFNSSKIKSSIEDRLQTTAS